LPVHDSFIQADWTLEQISARLGHRQSRIRAADWTKGNLTKGRVMTDGKGILVLGGTGKTGRRVVARLEQARVPTRIGSRSGEPPFDWDDLDTWAASLHGVRSAYVTYQPDLAFPGAGERVEAFAALAVESGVRRLVLLSGRNEEGAIRGEKAIRESCAEWTLVRSSFMNQNFSEGFWLELVLAGALAAPAGNVAEPFVDADDIADIVVAALTGDEHVGKLYEVTGPRLLTFVDSAEEIARATGRDVVYVPISLEEFAAGAEEAGLPPDHVRFLADLFHEVLDGRNAYLEDGVQRALGREPKDFADFARETAAAGIWTPALAA
jgi:uncharacterized protein YbjT (DUF2867 family)